MVDVLVSLMEFNAKAAPSREVVIGKHWQAFYPLATTLLDSHYNLLIVPWLDNGHLREDVRVRKPAERFSGERAFVCASIVGHLASFSVLYGGAREMA